MPVEIQASTTGGAARLYSGDLWTEMKMTTNKAATTTGQPK